MVEKLIDSNRAGVLQHFGKTDEDVKDYMNNLSEWISKQPHLPPMIAGDARKIEVLLTRKKFSVEKVKQLIELYYNIKVVASELFNNWDILDPRYQLALQTSAWVPLKKLTPNLEAVGIYRLLDDDTSKFDVLSSLILSFMTGELRCEVEYNLGEHIIFDLKGFTLQHILKLSPALVKKAYIAIKHSYGLRMVGFHILNAPERMDILLSMFKPVVSAKLYNRVKIHKNLDSLHKEIPKEILPKDYGGNEPSFCEILEKWKSLLIDNREKLIKLGQRRADESKRIEYFDTDILGSIHGSFRQLQID